MRDIPREEEEKEEENQIQNVDVVEVDLGIPAQPAPRTEAVMMQEFMKLQEQRCVAYNTLERCMREFRQMKQLCAFQGTMKEITETFQTVSLAIIQLSKELKEAGHLQSSKYCEDLQELEQMKLKLTAEMHIKLQALSRNDNEEDKAEVRRLTAENRRLIFKINDVLNLIRYKARPQEA
ncbi:uncharacterized protein LOC108667269 [Hyalella azteca]|uniref:Uncharacterized protein LOC108667269 n=1 Tax=Hyalella azteca TaxID=294128 RepID=A0A8B7N802_HYAAZ|nr:uncharacterized protein LOC108667269 [Hyalella azteca]